MPCIVRTQFCQSRPGFGDLRLTTEEKNWLADTCPYFSKDYLEYLSEFQFDPTQLSIKFIPISSNGEEGRVEIEASGLWREAILWEVPVMACLSELYFRVGATDWSYEGQKGEFHVLWSSYWLDLAPQRVRLQRRGHCCTRDVRLANSGLGEGGHFTPRTSSLQL